MLKSPLRQLSVLFRLAAVVLIPANLLFTLPARAQMPAPPRPRDYGPLKDGFMKEWVPPAPVVTPPQAPVNLAPLPERPSFQRRQLSATPKLTEIDQSRFFGVTLKARPNATVSTTERGELGRLARDYTNAKGRMEYRNVERLERFLKANPKSPVRGSLLLEQAQVARQHSHLLKAETSLRAAWAELKDRQDLEGRAQAEDALSQLLRQLGDLGRREQLRELLASVKDRKVGGFAAEAIWRGKEALGFMDSRAEQNIFCGFSAANTICVPRGQRPIFPDIHDAEEQKIFLRDGLSLFELRAHSLEAGGNLAIYKRTSGKLIPVPSVIHWSYGHYSSITAQDPENPDLYRVKDVHLKLDAWTPTEVINEQASGYFLLPADAPPPAGFAPVSDEEAKKVFGRHCSHARDDEGCNPRQGCNQEYGMTQYDLTLFNPGLWLEDSPVRYNTPFGYTIDVTLKYHQRSPVIPDFPNHSNFGPRWSYNYLTYVDLAGIGAPNSHVKVISGDGTYTNYHFNNTTYTYGTRFGDSPPLEYVTTVTTGPGYRLKAADGSTAEYFQPDAQIPTKYYLSRVIDPQGNALVMNYDPTTMRLVSIVDALGQATQFSYEPQAGDQYDADTYRIRKITDPFNRQTKFLYHSTGRLWKIIDPVGIVSEFRYTTGDFIDQLTTPYGVTTFAGGDLPGIGIPGRWIEAVDPLGNKQRAEQNEFAGHPSSGRDLNPPPVVPVGSENGVVTVNVGGQQVQFRPKLDNLYWRNTYVWDKKAWSMGPGDYSKATIFNWLADSAGKIIAQPGSIKRPLEGRVWFNYHNQQSNHSPGDISGSSMKLRAVETSPGLPPKWILEQTGYDLPNGSPHPYGLRTGAVDPEGRRMRFTYSSAAGADIRDIRSVDVLEGGVWKSLVRYDGYDSRHRPSLITYLGGLTESYTYNARGQVKTVTVSNASHSETTKYTYDRDNGEWGYLLKIERTHPQQPSNFVTIAEYTYDSAGRKWTYTNKAGYTVTFGYDAMDRLTLVTHPDSTNEQRVYEKLNLSEIKERGGRWTRFKYNALGEMSATQDPEGRMTFYDWCKCGAIAGITDPMGKTTRWKRDEQGRVMYKTYPDGATKTSFTYQPLSGRLSTVTQPNDQDTGNPTVTFRYSSIGAITSEDYTDPGTPDAGYGYSDSAGTPDILGRVRTMLSGADLTTFTYHPLTSNPPQPGASQLAITDGPWTDDRLKYDYDWRNRLVGRAVITDGLTPTTTWSESIAYDSLERITQTQNGLGTFTWNYSSGNRRAFPESIDGPNGLSTTFGYFPVTAPSGRALKLETITNTRNATPLSQFTHAYDVSGRLTTWTQKAGSDPANSYALTYNRVSELTDAVLKDSGQAVLHSASYSYDGSGNRYSSTEDGSLVHRQHNDLNRLTQIGGAGPTLVEGTINEKATVQINNQPAAVVPLPGSDLWKFERIIEVEEGQNTVQIKATDPNSNENVKTYQFTVGALQQSLTYDNNGNLLTDGTRTFTWDAKNRLKSVTIGETIYGWDYDCMDRRIAEKTNGVVTARWLWDGVSLVQMRTSENVVAKNLFSEGEQWLTGSNAGNYHTTRDHLGSVRELLDATGAVRARYTYKPYGKVTKVNGDLESEFGYAGHRYHIPTGLPLTLFRAYDPEMGRWLSEDPIGVYGGLNLYRYGSNNPIQRVDPLGLADYWVGIEGDAVAVAGFEAGVGLVLDTDCLWDSGLNFTGGPAGGWNFGIGIGGGRYNEVEGTSLNVDANVGVASPSGNWAYDYNTGQYSFNGAGASFGPGKGASGSIQFSGTISAGMLCRAARHLWDFGKFIIFNQPPVY